jgi:carboxypeptidase Taq
MNAEKAYQFLIADLREIGVLSSTASLLAWDQRTRMAEKGTEYRGKQSALLAGMIHRRMTDDRVGAWLSDIGGAGGDSDVAVNVREVRRNYERARKVPEELVREMAELSVLSQRAWIDARKKSDFAQFAPWLTKIVALKRREAECVGYREHLYDALLDEYEPGETAAGVRKVFDDLRGPLVELVGRIVASGKNAPVHLLRRRFPIERQRKLAHQAARKLGYDFSAGGLEETVHPMCCTLGPHDVRMSTRYGQRSLGDSLFSVLHETGHCLYEQGLPPEHFGTPRGESVSLGIHESQSRMWENFIGRSRAFGKWLLPILRREFPQAMKGVTEMQWYAAVNDVRPSFIRTESDEATYNLHVLLRFELEQAMLTGDLAVADVPAAWNAKMKQYLGIVPPDAARGALQDIHWSLGSIGYFPTYTLGNLYAAQFFETATQELGDVAAMLKEESLLPWLRRKIHRHGKRYGAKELVKRVTGKDASAGALMRHLNRKAREIYGV